MRIITVENEKIAIPSAAECVGNTTATIHTKRGKYLMTISYQSSIDTAANNSLYTTVIEISLPLYTLTKYDHILLKYDCVMTINDGNYTIYYNNKSKDTPNVVSVYETAVSLLVDIIRADHIHSKSKNDLKTCISGMDITQNTLMTMMSIIEKNNISIIDFYIKTVCGHHDIARSAEFKCVMNPYISEIITITYTPEDELLDIHCTNGYDISINNVATIDDFDKYMTLTPWIFL